MVGKVFSVLLLAAIFAPISLVSTGCPQGGGDSGPPIPESEQLSTKNNLTEDDKLHFLRRTHFSFNPIDLQRVNQMGYGPYLDWMLDFQVDPALEASAMAATIADADYPGDTELVRWWLYLMANNQNAFQELLALFWHDHFAASTSVLPAEARWWTINHINMWRMQGTGNLRDLLHAMTIDWQMLEWLDGVRSTRTAPNENFAREFWELFTLGADNGYTQEEIIEGSKAFTGFRTRLIADHAGPGRDRLIVEFNANRHDNTVKNIFGTTVGPNGEGEYLDMVDVTLANRPVLEFLCRKIWEHFVYLNPSDALIADLANGLRGNMDLGALFKRIFSSRAFFSPEAKVGLVKSPVECVVGFMRTTGLRLTESRADNNLSAMGQRPTQPPTVNGWPSGEFWLSAQGLLERANFLRDAVFYRNETPQVGFDISNWVNAGQTSAEQVVDRFAWVLRVTPNAAQRLKYIEYLNQDRQGNGTIIDQPWDFNDGVQREKKLRGLMYMLGQHPSYTIR